jgi:hypothetical protein
VTPLSKWFRNTLERLLERYEEGERPPARLREQVIMFASMNPHATRAEWVTFAAGLAEEAYQSGYIRGVEWCERDESATAVGQTPEMIADAIDPSWRDRPWQPQVYLDGNPDAVVPETRHPDEQLTDELRRLKPRRF